MSASTALKRKESSAQSSARSEQSRGGSGANETVKFNLEQNEEAGGYDDEFLDEAALANIVQDSEKQEEVHSVKLVVSIMACFPIDSEESQENASPNRPRLTEGPKPIVRFFS